MARKHSESGQGVVEFALAAVVFFVIVWGIVDVARGIWYQSTLQDAVQEATRYAVVHGSLSSTPVGPGDGLYTAGPPSSDSTITNVVTKYSTALRGTGLGVTANWPQGANNAGDTVTVTATYPFTTISTFFGSWNLTLSASSTRDIVR